MRYFLISICILVCGLSHAQDSLHNFKVTVLEKEGKNGVPFTIVQLMRDEKTIQIGPTNFDGQTQFKNVEAGKYTLVAHLGAPWKTEIRKEVVIPKEKDDLVMIAPAYDPKKLDEVEVIEYEVPIEDLKK